MNFPRTLLPVVFVALLAACSGNLGGGQSTLPGAPTNGTNSNVQQVQPVTATPTPVAASNVATLGAGTAVAPQALPTINGFGGSITFPPPSPSASPSPNGKTTAAPADPNANTVSVGITASTVEPTDAPHFSGVAKRHGKRDPYALTPLLFISLLATSDVTLGEYPKIAVDVPREIASKHRDDTYALALFDPEQKDKSYHLGIADRDLTSSPLPGMMPTPVPTQRPSPTPSPNQFGVPFQGSLTPPPVGQGLGSNTSGLPPERVAFKGTTATLALKANRPAVFALYAIPPTPTPSPSAAAGGSPSPSPAASSATTLPTTVPTAMPSAAPAAPSAVPTSAPR